MATKRVILANNSRLLRELFQRAINKADTLEVVLDIPNHEDLSSAIERLDPAWVILSSASQSSGRHSINTYVAEYPSVRFIILSPDNRKIKMKWQASCEEDLSNLSLQDFIHILQYT